MQNLQLQKAFHKATSSACSRGRLPITSAQTYTSVASSTSTSVKCANSDVAETTKQQQTFPTCQDGFSGVRELGFPSRSSSSSSSQALRSVERVHESRLWRHDWSKLSSCCCCFSPSFFFKSQRGRDGSMRRQQSVSQSVSRVVLMQSGRRVQGVRAADSDHWTFDCVCALLAVAASAVAHTARGGERRVRGGSGRGSGARNSQERHVCHCYLRANRTIPRERFPKRSSHSPRYVSGVANSASYLAFQTAGGDVEPCRPRQTFNFAGFQTQQP